MGVTRNFVARGLQWAALLLLSAAPAAALATHLPGHVVWNDTVNGCRQSGCHSATANPQGNQLNAAGSNANVLDYVITNQSNMAANAATTGLTAQQRIDVSAYVLSVLPAITASVAFNTATAINVNSHLHVTSVGTFTGGQTVANPTNGTLSAWTGTSVTYTPTAGYIGPDSFTYRGIGGVTSVTRTVSITVAQGTQTITFPAQTTATRSSSGGSFAISPVATASSGLTVTYGSSTPTVCTASGTTVSILAAGLCTITANQAGNANYTAAAQQTQNVSITANLSVTKPGDGSGTVTSSPGGISCGGVCSADFAGNTSVTLTATPDVFSQFTGWSGACAGTGTCDVTMQAARNVAATFTAVGTLLNISTRMQVLTGNDVMIGGFVISGSANKTVVVRARGPSLVPFGITNALANPTLRLVQSSDQSTIAINDDWQSAANSAAVTASGFAPSNNLESAILINLPPGAYTAIVSGVGGGTGVGIVEVFEVDHPEVPLANISTRGQVLTGNDVMIGGFVIQGSGPQTVVIRARGPSLIPFGITNALANPTLQLVRSSDQATLDFNDNWQSHPNQAALSASGFAPSNSLESAILTTLQPGAYTVIVSGVGGGTGVAIVEVFAQ